MTHYLGKPDPVPYVDEDDLLLVAGDKGAGVFTAAELYEWYAMALEQVGREPVSRRWFGSALKEAGWANLSRKVDQRMTRCWRITNPWARRGEEFVSRN